MKRLTQNEFLQRVIKLYGNKYLLDKVVYKHNKAKVKIGCKTHGYFEIRPNDLLQGYGCPKCGGTKKMTTDEFIQKAKFVHDNYFTYEKTRYVNNSTKITVTCPVHGDFQVKPNNHLNGANCRQCYLEGINHTTKRLPSINTSTKKISQEDFLKRAIDNFGDRYDFSKSEYLTSNSKIIVTCKKHGDFKITPTHLFHGRGCPICAKNKQLNTKEFIKKAQEIHGLKYDYSKSYYKSTHELVKITCPKHGDFLQMPSNHLRGQGCPKCHEFKLEIEVRKMLTSLDIVFEEQKRFSFMGRLSIDFYIPSVKIGIECQGIQHFKPIERYGGDNAYAKQIQRDELKQKICKNNGIHLIYYSDLQIVFPYEVINNINDLKGIIKTQYGRIKENM
jgi:Zn finger protein HypA/HybF involved in hydrogenase expression